MKINKAHFFYLANWQTRCMFWKESCFFKNASIERKMVMKIEFKNFSGAEQHECESYRDGDWIIFRCPVCKEYERRLNWRTGKMSVQNGSKDINHTGYYYPHDLKDVLLNPN